MESAGAPADAPMCRFRKSATQFPDKDPRPQPFEECRKSWVVAAIGQWRAKRLQAHFQLTITAGSGTQCNFLTAEQARAKGGAALRALFERPLARTVICNSPPRQRVSDISTRLEIVVSTPPAGRGGVAQFWLARWLCRCAQPRKSGTGRKSWPIWHKHHNCRPVCGNSAPAPRQTKPAVPRDSKSPARSARQNTPQCQARKRPAKTGKMSRIIHWKPPHLRLRAALLK